jgi:hypothetical protein
MECWSIGNSITPSLHHSNTPILQHSSTPLASRWFPLLVCVLLGGGCSILRAPSTGAKALAHTVERTIGIPQHTNLVALAQTGVMREADSYVTAVAEAVNDFAAKARTDDARKAALQWKLHEGTAAFSIAVGENPVLNAVDFVVLATLSRQVVEDYWVGEKYGDAARPWLEVQRTLETNAWSFVMDVLTFEQRVELRDLIKRWSEQHPHQRYVAAIRLRDFMTVIGNKGLEAQANHGSGFSELLNFDPFSSLDPAVREVQRTRVFGERTLFYLQHFPMLLSWQMEALTYQIAAQPAPQQVISNLTSFAESAHVFAGTAQQLPDLVNQQREAAINQFFVGVASERSNILAALNAQESKLRELQPQIRQTLEAGGQMGHSISGAVKTLDQFVRDVSPPQTNPAAKATNAHPFNVAEFGNAATQVAAMSKDIGQLLVTADQSATQLTTLSKQVATKANQTVDRTFRLGLALIALLLVGSVLAGLAYRFLANRLGLSPVSRD